MKKVVSVVFLALALLTICVVSYPAHSQSAPKDSANTAALIAKMRGTFIKDTLIAGQLRPMYTGAKGGKYIIRTSSVTGKPYKQYFKH